MLQQHMIGYIDEVWLKATKYLPLLASLVGGLVLCTISTLVILPARAGIKPFPADTAIPKICGGCILGTMAVFVGWFGRDDLSFADACLATGALFLFCASLFPIFYVFRKWLTDGQESLDIEISTCLWALVAIGFALGFGITGKFAFAMENDTREASTHTLNQTIASLTQGAEQQGHMLEGSQKHIADLEAKLSSSVTQQQAILLMTQTQLKNLSETIERLKPQQGRTLPLAPQKKPVTRIHRLNAVDQKTSRP